MPRLCINLCPGICLTPEENHGKTSVRASGKCSGYQCRARLVWSTWRSTSLGLQWSAGARCSRFQVRATGPTAGKGKYLLSCRTKVLSSSAKFESKLALRVLTWSAKKGTPKSSWICLLLRYQAASAIRRRHLDCITCSLQARMRAADLQAGHAYSMKLWMSCLYRRTPFLMERSLLVFRRGPNKPIL
jgi:hypothetical protein